MPFDNHAGVGLRDNWETVDQLIARVVARIEGGEWDERVGAVRPRPRGRLGVRPGPGRGNLERRVAGTAVTQAPWYRP